MSINWTPRGAIAAPSAGLNTATAESAALVGRHASARPWIVSDLDLPVSGSRTFDLTGAAWIAGYTVVVDTESFTAAANTTTDIYLGLVRDGNGNVTDVTLADVAHASGDYVRLGAVSCDATDVTGRNYANRSPETQVDPPVTSLPASSINYNNSTSGLAATDVQDAIDELVARPEGSVVIVGFVGQNVPVEANSIYLLEVVCAVAATGTRDFTISAPAGATAIGYVEEVGPLASGGAVAARGASNVSILSYTAQTGTTVIASVKAYGKLQTSGTAGNLNLSVTNMDSYSYIKVTKQ